MVNIEVKAKAKVGDGACVTEHIGKARSERRKKILEDEGLAMELVLRAAALRATTDWGEESPPHVTFTLTYDEGDTGA